MTDDELLAFQSAVDQVNRRLIQFHRDPLFFCYRSQQRGVWEISSFFVGAAIS